MLLTRRPLECFHPYPSWSEQPAQSWWNALVSCLQECTARIDPRRFAAMAISHQRETFIPIDHNGTPLRNAILWMDERNRSMLPALQAQLDPAQFHRLTGKPLSVNLAIGKINWLRQFEPSTFQNTTLYADIHAYLVHCLTGQYATALGSADPTGLFDMTTQTWATPFLETIGITAEQLPPVYPSGHILRELTNPAAALTGLHPGLPIIAGLGDGQAAGLGTGVCQPGIAYLNLGTAVVSGVQTTSYLTDASFRTMYSGIPHQYFLETVLLGGTYTINWSIENFPPVLTKSGTYPVEALDSAAASIPPGCEGLILLPYWNSVMNPYWDETASGAIIGWRGHHTRAHLHRAILEGIAFEQRLAYQNLQQTTHQPIEQIICVGGGSRSALWRQIIADCTGIPVARSTTPEASALGAGILAAYAVGWYPSIASAAQAMAQPFVEPTIPQSSVSDFYTSIFKQIYQPLYPTLRLMMKALAGITSTA